MGSKTSAKRNPILKDAQLKKSLGGNLEEGGHSKLLVLLYLSSKLWSRRLAWETKQDSTSNGKRLTEKQSPWEGALESRRNICPDPGKATEYQENTELDSVTPAFWQALKTNKHKSCADYKHLLFRPWQIKCIFAQHEPAIPSEVSGKPEPPQQGWKPEKKMLKLCSVEEGHQPQSRGSCTIGSLLPEVESSTDAMQWEGTFGDHKQKMVLGPVSRSGHAEQPHRTAP